MKLKMEKSALLEKRKFYQNNKNKLSEEQEIENKGGQTSEK